ncbi:MAG: tRNA (N6-isopentenyl adenosine(37)-C2)-methylthiotransferase MiaB [Oscillospiraceae bacterium]|nr:tRNA (N6-isopentenyl adenosine(37)-C2)-methylthiotransferase MiaB [Oscillospiraceae bacterium]
MAEKPETQLAEGRHYIAQLREIMQVRKRGEKPLAFVHTYGCQQNVADSEKIKGMLAEIGFSFAEKPDDADFILFNTCAVREHAEDRVFGNVGALKNIKRRHSGVIIALCGCMMEQEHVAQRIHDSYPFVNLLFGTHQICSFPKLLFTCITESRRVFARGGEEQDREITEGLPIHRDGSVKAWLTVMYGCDNFCSYCVVPYVRGRERSRTPQAVLAEFQQLVDEGYKDITLLGQNVNSYGKKPDCGMNFSQLLQMLDKVEGDYRIRFMTSHPKDCTHELLDTMANGKHIAHHLHLPFQSGNDRVLKEMNRHYDRAQYLELVQYAKKVMPDLSLTSDVIVGFPGETYEEFKDTVSLIEEVGFTSLFTFIYSPREGTRAAKMPDPVPAEEKSRWFQELCAAQEKIAAQRCASAVGTVQRVLVEEQNPKTGLLTGRTGGNVVVDFPGNPAVCGTFRKVKITAARNWILTGKLIDE